MRARALAASERLSASVRFQAVTGRPSRQLLQLGCAMTGLMRRNTRHVSHRRRGRAIYLEL
jgi:hypothetical protein